MKTVRFTVRAALDMKRHGNMAARAQKAIEEYAADGVTHANNVKQLVGSPAKRMRIGDFRMIFEETVTEILVTKFAPRGRVYD
jgi:mRNA interferase RelE/StbE